MRCLIGLGRIRLCVYSDTKVIRLRLTENERRTLKQLACDCFEGDAIVRLFGSRLADQGRGGDIDLLIETKLSDPAQISRAHSRFLARVYSTLGEQKVDVLIDYPNRSHRPPVYEVARRQGVLL